MFESEHEERHWQFYIQDMIEFSEKVLVYTEGFDQESFLSDALTYDATLRNLQLIGEAASHIPESVRETHSHIPWHAIILIRDRLAHAYLIISDSIIWGIVQDTVQDLLPALINLRDATTQEFS